MVKEKGSLGQSDVLFKKVKLRDEERTNPTVLKTNLGFSSIVHRIRSRTKIEIPKGNRRLH